MSLDALMNVTSLHGDHSLSRAEADAKTSEKDIHNSPPTVFTVSNKVNLRRELDYDTKNTYSDISLQSRRNYDFHTVTDFSRAGTGHLYDYGYLSSAALSFNYFNIREGQNKFVFFVKHSTGTLGDVEIEIKPQHVSTLGKLCDILTAEFKEAIDAASGYGSDFTMTVSQATKTINGTTYDLDQLKFRLDYTGSTYSAIKWHLKDAPSQSQPSYELITRKVRTRLLDINKVTGVNWNETGATINESGLGQAANADYVNEREVNLFHIRNVKIMSNLVTNSYGGALCVIHHDNIAKGHLQVKHFKEQRDHAFEMYDRSALENLHIRVVDEENVALEGFGSVSLTFGVYQAKKQTSHSKRARIA